MAEQKRDPKTKDPRQAEARLSSGWTRLSVMPFSVLLPRVGDLANLVNLTEEFQLRLDELRSGAGETEDDVKKQIGEEAMLIQVLQWMNAGE